MEDKRACLDYGCRRAPARKIKIHGALGLLKDLPDMSNTGMVPCFGRSGGRESTRKINRSGIFPREGWRRSRGEVMITTDDIKEKGVVGAGGAGFPAYVKMGSCAEMLIVNAAECEPLLHKDMEILLNRTDAFFTGLSRAALLCSAEKIVIGIKKKQEAVIRHLEPRLAGNVSLFPLRDFYPAGDEITLIFEVTGRIVPPGALPISRGVVVSNVETLYNIGKEGPVISKFLTVGGAVESPASMDVPLGTPYREVLKTVRPIPDRFDVVVGGPMMGRLAKDLDEPVTKTTGGLIVLPEGHLLKERMTVGADEKTVNRIAGNACDQCAFCSELCPRALIGHPVRPHLAMRKLMFPNGKALSSGGSAHTLFCCECNLCSVAACPEGLYPSRACGFSKRAHMKEKVGFTGDKSASAHPLVDYRRVPVQKIKERLDLGRFPDTGPLMEEAIRSGRLTLPLSQHIGAPAKPLVKAGQEVTKGEKIASVGKDLGAEIHASARGIIVEVNDKAIVLERRERT